MFIHPTAIVDAQVCLNDSLTIGPFCQIEAGVVLGKNVVVEGHAVLKKGTRLEDGVHIHDFACIGGDPQIKNLNGAFSSGVRIGARTIIREGVTVHRASEAGAITTIGSDCLLMAYSHVGHDCRVGNGCTLANNALLAGCVHVEDFVFLSGGSMVHQFVTLGESAFVAGNATITMHVPPFVTVLERNRLKNLNVIGLRRRGFSTEEVADVKACYRHVFGHDNLAFQRKAQEALQIALSTTSKGRQFLEFFVKDKSDRGFVYPFSQSQTR
ncbi:MAG: acyl-ACP--UDP-N-acetylglucosamine O-acyltransferase [Puniceicoccales bacterium]|jgi:UDP-N-acetylglucosamine acyltransferase|nr:acyl-ACP--UDP-N-acetylglucosamine O-acyltransferase [Puniceicoccales bacterium]